MITSSLGAAAALLAGCASPEPGAQENIGRRMEARSAAPAVSLAERPDSPAVRAAVAELLHEPLTPDRAARVALVNNRHLRAALAEADFAEADLWRAARLPNPDFSAAMRWPAGGGPTTSTVALGFNALDGLLIPLRKRLARQALDAAERRAAHEALGLIAEVETALLTLAAREEWRARLAVLHAEDANRGELEARRSGRPLSAAHARAQAAETEAELAWLAGQIARDRERLNQLMGLAGAEAAIWTLAGRTAPAPALIPNAEALENIAAATRLDLAADRVDVALVRRAFELERRTRLLPVGIGVGVESEKESSGARLTGPTVRLGVPIFDQGQAEMLRLGAALAQAEDRAAALETDIRAEARAGAATVDATRRLAWSRRDEQLPQARRIWTESARSAGPLARHWARRELIAAERQEIEARRDYWLARVALARALGGSPFVLAGGGETPAG